MLFYPKTVNKLAISAMSIMPKTGENPKTSWEAPELLLGVAAEFVAVLVPVFGLTVSAVTGLLEPVFEVSVGLVPPEVGVAPAGENPSAEQPETAVDRSAASVALTVA